MGLALNLFLNVWKLPLWDRLWQLIMTHWTTNITWAILSLSINLHVSFLLCSPGYKPLLHAMKPQASVLAEVVERAPSPTRSRSSSASEHSLNESKKHSSRGGSMGEPEPCEDEVFEEEEEEVEKEESACAISWPRHGWTGSMMMQGKPFQEERSSGCEEQCIHGWFEEKVESQGCTSSGGVHVPSLGHMQDSSVTDSYLLQWWYTCHGMYKHKDLCLVNF